MKHLGLWLVKRKPQPWANAPPTEFHLDCSDAQSALLLTGDESYDTKTYEELLLRAAETLLGPVGWPARRIRSWLDAS